ncbi:hypothetical protein [Endozoicomonas sp. 8E]|uniref:hypothetical protein n=1 Tax=Endozoicomonas sp. 8E TaxID=3035692 RepID=UPI002938F111|nr:hypothetical protein [Endozoicomonas sp. 8E]WOG26305.1 hypothetical protein P6910_17270 [Endozoicomonas sp. 8E]
MNIREETVDATGESSHQKINNPGSLKSFLPSLGQKNLQNKSTMRKPPHDKLYHPYHEEDPVTFTERTFTEKTTT